MHLTESRLDRIRGRARALSVQPLPPTVRAYLDRAPTWRQEPPASITGNERRCSRRLKLKSGVIVRGIGGANVEVALNNMSTGGCRVELLESGAVGETVIARFTELEPLGARICWTSGRATGLEFFNRIHPAVLDRLVSRLANQ